MTADFLFLLFERKILSVIPSPSGRAREGTFTLS
jgi:hypothetical protein